MRYCSKCGNPLKDDEIYCPKCGNKEPLIVETTDGSLPPIENKPKVQKTPILERIKELDKFAYIYNYVLMCLCLVYFVASIFLYINRNTKEFNFVWINQILAICVAAFTFFATILYIAIYIKKKKETENKRTKKVATYLAIMILAIVSLGLAVGQIFIIPLFGVSVMDFVVLLICSNINASVNKIE